MERLSDRWMYYCGLLAMHGVEVDDMKHIQNLIYAEEQGLLHKAQLKDGTPIYVLRCDWDDDYVVHEEVYLYGMTENLIGEINKDWFLTKEEAEQALQALKEGDNNG